MESKYDDEEVEFCNACSSLHIVEDEFENVWCKNCDSLNHTSKAKNIYDYFLRHKKNG